MTNVHTAARQTCPVCRSGEFDVPVDRARRHLNAESFRITDSAYGQTGPLYRCRGCGFRYVVFPEDVLAYYESMEDPDYERGRGYRTLQQRRLLERLRAALPNATSLLDVGAGTGMLVEEALAQGLTAIGVEPSRWSAQVAKDRGLPVLEGALPHVELSGRTFDAVTLVDVIEHVPDPVGLLRLCADHIRPGGGLLVVTPDVGSLAARVMGRRWWHYRMAHIGYFDVRTLKLALAKSGLTPLTTRRPSWFFEARYLYARVRRYVPLPDSARFDSGFASRVLSMQLPLNLGDSLELVARKP